MIYKPIYNRTTAPANKKSEPEEKKKKKAEEEKRSQKKSYPDWHNPGRASPRAARPKP